MLCRISLIALLDSIQVSSVARGYTTRRCASTVAQKQRKHNDPYALAQAQARKAANLSRQGVLREEHSKAMGSPIHGVETPFLRSFDTALPSSPQSSSPLDPPTSHSASLNGENLSSPEHLNHFVSSAGLLDLIVHSQDLNQLPPLDAATATATSSFDATKTSHDQRQANAQDALSRIAAVDNANSKDRMRINVQRCIDTFGRHNTDNTLRPKPTAAIPHAITRDSSQTDTSTVAERAGADTGSSEVQIAILTAKIRTLAQFLEGRGRKDKVNKRNLRLLVHKRQKLLVYLRRKERGGERWQHLVQSLGLTEGTWKGEISL